MCCVGFVCCVRSQVAAAFAEKTRLHRSRKDHFVAKHVAARRTPSEIAIELNIAIPICAAAAQTLSDEVARLRCNGRWGRREDSKPTFHAERDRFISRPDLLCRSTAPQTVLGRQDFCPKLEPVIKRSSVSFGSPPRDIYSHATGISGNRFICLLGLCFKTEQLGFAAKDKRHE